ncbi:MAG: ferredoxin reductase family protein [Candidatus Limnocylindrales bacterium]
MPLPRTWGLRLSDVVLLLVGNGVLMLGMWVRHGGLEQLAAPGGFIIAAGQLTALAGTYLALIQLVLMSRSPWLDQLLGMDRLTWAHRWVGFSCVWLLVAHAAFTTVGYAMGDGSTVVGEAVALLTTFPYVLLSAIALVLFIVVAASSVRAARGRLSYEAWYVIHLSVYLAIALAFLHQLVVGTDFINDPLARLYWIGLYVLAGGLIVTFRLGQPIYRSLRHQLRVANVVEEAPGVVSVYLTGRDLDLLPVRAGQYFLWRFLTRAGWWRAHPFSISAAPNGQWLRLTIKELGDYTGDLQQLRIGTRVFAEGPYGVLTGARRTRQRVLLIAGGIGITPLRALLEELPAAPGELTLIYRARSWQDVVFREELDVLMQRRGATVHYLVGQRQRRDPRADPLSSRALRELVPDIQQRDVFLCGPTGMMQAVRANLRRLGLTSSQIHWEQFAY